MGEKTGIAWTDHTFNPWIGCTKVSAACDHCYAETLAKRYGWAKWGAGEPRVRTSTANWRKPLQWDRAAKAEGVRRRVFCASLADVFDAEVLQEWRGDLMELIESTPSLDWLLLTKRPQVAKKFFANRPVPKNVWLGTTVEDHKMAELRIPIMLSIPAKIHFLSCEPLLGYIDVFAAKGNASKVPDWIIVGGESGAGARPMDIVSVMALYRHTRDAKTAFFMKQLGGARDKRDRLEDFPTGLRVREFPGEEGR